MTSYKKKITKSSQGFKPASNINKNRNQEKRKKRKKGKKELCKYLLILVLKNTISRETRTKNEATIK